MIQEAPKVSVESVLVGDTQKWKVYYEGELIAIYEDEQWAHKFAGYINENYGGL